MRNSNSNSPAGGSRRFANLPIKRKLVLIIMVVTSAALLIAGVGLVAFDFVQFRNSLRRDLLGLARITAENNTATLSFDDPSTASENLAALRFRPHLVSACIFDADGTLFAQFKRSTGSAPCPPPAAQEQEALQSGNLTLSYPILLTGKRIGTLVMLYDLEEVYQRVQLYGGAALALLLSAGLIAFLLSSNVQKLIAMPITELAGTAAAVSQTRDYSIRAEKRSRDEIGVLVDGFNEMLTGIQSRDLEVRRALAAREEALTEARNASDLLKTTLASIGDAVVSTDSDGRLVFCNPVACSLLHRPQEQVLGCAIDEVFRLINENTRAAVENPVARVLREGTIVGLANHTILVTHDGFEIPIDDSAAPIRNHKGELIGVVLIFRDITERRRAEQELLAAREQLQVVTDAMAPAVSYCDRELRYVWVSPSYAQFVRLTPDDIAGRTIGDVLGSQALATLQPYIERALAGESLEYEAEVDYAMLGRRAIHATYVPTHDVSGGVNGWVAHVSDITALKTAEAGLARANADLQRSNERLARSNEDLQRFAFAASHDLQEPLRMITTYVQLLVRTYPEQFLGEGKLFVDNIVDGAVRMRSLLTDLLAYSEVTGGTEEPLQQVDLNQVIEMVRQQLKLTIEETGTIVTADELPAISGYTAHFVQLFQNLIGNAIKYRGPQPPRIHISSERTGDQFQFSVADNGMGIDPAYHNKIFGVFKRLHGKKIPGTGIGLAICQRVVERYRGRIWVESQLGQGATFFFTLPANTITTEGKTNEASWGA